MSQLNRATFPLSRRLRRTDEGIALLAVIMFMFVALALGAIAGTTAIQGQKQAGADVSSAGSQATADVGVAQAISYLQSNSLGALNCTEPLTSDTPSVDCSQMTGWANNMTPEVVVVGASGTPPTSCKGAVQACYEVWIGTLQYYVPGGGPGQPATPAVLRIHSTGFTGGGPAARSLDVDISVLPDHYPIGLYGNTIYTNGNPATASESVFAAGSISIKCPPTGFDYEYHIPAAVHAAGTITYGPGAKCGVNGTIHPPACSTARPFDQDQNGGPLTSGDGCYEQGPVQYPPTSYPGSVTTYPTTSAFTANDLASYGYQPDGLTSAQYAALKSEAQAQNSYFTTATSAATALSNLAAANVANAVVYYDFPSGSSQTVDLSQVIPSYYYRSYPQPSPCSQHSVVIVVRNGDVKWTANTNGAVVALFVPEGTYTGAGTASIIGTLFAYNIDITGTQTFVLDPCFVSDPPGGVLDITINHYRLVNTVNVQ